MPRMRWRTARHVGRIDGQPETPLIPVVPEDQPVSRPKTKTCAECFGPRSAYSDTPFCNRCETRLFGLRGYPGFLRSEARYRIVERLRAAKRLAETDTSN